MIPTDPDREPDIVETAHRVVMEATAQRPKTRPLEEREDEDKEPVADCSMRRTSSRAGFREAIDVRRLARRSRGTTSSGLFGSDGTDRSHGSAYS